MLERCLRTAYRIHPQSRNFSSVSRLFAKDDKSSQKVVFEDPDIRDIAILGGGITGLTSAYFAALLHPNAKVTLFESSKRLGGWLLSTKFETDGGTVIFEQGPRSLRPTKGTLALISQLGLEEDLLTTGTYTAAARNRYIYHQDRLVNISGGNILFKAWKEPLVRSAFIELFKTFIQKSRIPDNKDDETIGDFFRRRGCPDIANNMVSAMIHGIYAGDIDELSVMSVFPSIVLWEQRFGSPYECLKWHVLEYLIGISGLPQISNYQQREFNHFYADDILSRMSSKDKLLSASIYTLRGGLQTLSTALMENLRRNPRVKLITEATVDHIGSVSTIEDKNKVRIMIRNSQTDIRTAGQDFDRVISTIPSVNLGSICHPLKSIFSQSTASTVCVVNLFYKETDLKSAKGFGYLIPKSIPKSQNPEGALGVVFDSDATPELDEAPGTKLTVMLGGPAWKGVSKQQLPSNEDAIDMAQNVIMSHLGITQKPVLAQANLHTDCIPQYTIGHRQRMQRASEIMTKGDEAWMGSVRVAGSSYGGVGVNDCIENAWYTTAHLRHRTYFGNETACVPRVWSDA